MIYACYRPWQRSFSYLVIFLSNCPEQLYRQTLGFLDITWDLRRANTGESWNPGHLGLQGPLDNGTPGSLPPSYVFFVEELEKALLVGKITVFLRSWGRLLAQFFANGSLSQTSSSSIQLGCNPCRYYDEVLVGFELEPSLLWLWGTGFTAVQQPLP